LQQPVEVVRNSPNVLKRIYTWGIRRRPVWSRESKSVLLLGAAKLAKRDSDSRGAACHARPNMRHSMRNVRRNPPTDSSYSTPSARPTTSTARPSRDHLILTHSLTLRTLPSHRSRHGFSLLPHDAAHVHCLRHIASRIRNRPLSAQLMTGKTSGAVSAKLYLSARSCMRVVVTTSASPCCSLSP
jgi:hypothetical protein